MSELAKGANLFTTFNWRRHLLMVKVFHLSLVLKLSLYILPILFNDFVICTNSGSGPNQQHVSIAPNLHFGQEAGQSNFPASCPASSSFLMVKSSDPPLNYSDQVDLKLWNLLNRNGRDLRPARDFDEYKDIGLDVSQRAWTLLNDRAHSIVIQQVSSLEPAVREILSSANVSQRCKTSVDSLLEGARRFESWAIQILNSWGSFPPSGLFDGTYSHPGSYVGCLKVNSNPIIDHAHYCTIFYRPIIPTAQKFAPFFRKEHSDLLNVLRPRQQVSRGSYQDGLAGNSARGALEDILENANYFHYVHSRIGTCWPIGCSPFDIRRVAKLIGRRNVLMSGPVKCFSDYSGDYEEPGSIDIISDHNATIATNQTMENPKAVQQVYWKKLEMSTWDVNDGIFIIKPYIKRTQLVALALIGVLFSLITVMTLIDFMKNYLPKMSRELIRLLRESSNREFGPGSEFSSDMAGRYKRSNFELSEPNIGHRNSADDLQRNDNHNCQLSSGSNINDDLNQPNPINNLNMRDLPAALNKSDGSCNNNVDNLCSNHLRQFETSRGVARDTRKKTGIIEDLSLIENTFEFFTIRKKPSGSEVSCLHGLRCIAMVWIVLAHTLMYNDWSSFSRIYEVESALKAFISQPIFYASYLVDTFFLMSGLVTAFVLFKYHLKQKNNRFDAVSFVLFRWLRLTPQMMFVACLYIVVPLLSSGPVWYPLVGEYSDNCINHWWINLLQIQAFYKNDQMCNFATWWISLDFYYHLVAIGIIFAFFKRGHLIGSLTVLFITIAHVAWQTYKHYQASFPPALFSTVPQMDAMWSGLILNLFWSPETHAVPYFFGFYTGYLLTIKVRFLKKLMSGRLLVIGWFLATSSFVVQSYSTYFWLTDKASYSRIVSTVYFDLSPIIWSLRLVWIIVTCHLGFGGFLNRFFSAKIFVILGKASYMIYLSHFLILFLFFGSQTLLLEPTMVSFSYIIIGNIFLSTILGIILSIAVEFPMLRLQKRIMNLMYNPSEKV